MSSGFDPLTLILLAAAIIVFWRLRSVLGQRTGFEKPPVEFPSTAKPAPAEARSQPAPVEIEGTATEVPPPVWQGYAEKDSDLAKGLEAIASKSPEFTVGEFLKGANLAYEMILEAFAKGNKSALKPLLSKEVFDSFSGAIDTRAKTGETTAFQFVGMKKAAVTQASLKANKAAVTVDFISQMISATRNAKGEIIDGDATAIRDVSDVWTFERDTSSRDPNWKLVSTQDNG